MLSACLRIPGVALGCFLLLLANSASLTTDFGSSNLLKAVSLFFCPGVSPAPLLFLALLLTGWSVPTALEATIPCLAPLSACPRTGRGRKALFCPILVLRLARNALVWIGIINRYEIQIHYSMIRAIIELLLRGSMTNRLGQNLKDSQPAALITSAPVTTQRS